MDKPVTQDFKPDAKKESEKDIKKDDEKDGEKDTGDKKAKDTEITKKEAKKEEPKQEQVNCAKALWTMAKSSIKDEEYQEFYKNNCSDFENPLTWVHSKVEGQNEYASLLYIPARAPFDLWNREQQKGIKLYVKQVFIMDDAEN